ncbi:MAG: hypothetical protein AB1942_21150 [Pseudomonadota bacterium]
MSSRIRNMIRRGALRRPYVPPVENPTDFDPDPFDFDPVTNAVAGQVYVSAVITVAGINVASPVAISTSGGAGEFRKNGGAWSSSLSSVVNGDTIQVRATASLDAGGAVSVTLTIGGVSANFVVTTDAVVEAQAWDITNIAVLGPTPIVTIPTNNIVPNGSALAITIKDGVPGQAQVASRGRVLVRYPAFTGGVATTRDEWVGFNGFMRMPFPKAYSAGQTPMVGEWRSNRAGGFGHMYEVTAVPEGGAPTAVAPTHTTLNQIVALADGYSYKYLGNPSQHTGESQQVPAKRIETVTGGDLTIYPMLSKSIPQGATIVDVEIQTGFYGANRASNLGLISFDYQQTWLRPQPYVVPLTEDHQLLRGGDVLQLESVIETHSGEQGRTFDTHKWFVKTSAGLTVDTITRVYMSRSTIATGGESIVQVAKAAYDTTALADGDYYVSEKCTPFEGRYWDSEEHGYGPAGLSPTSALTINVGRRIHFTKDAANSIVRRHAFVDGGAFVGGGGVAAVSTSEAAARSTPYATHKAASDALRAANGNVSTNAGVITTLDKGSAYTAGFGGNMSSNPSGKIPLIIRGDPTAAPLAIEFNTVTGTSNANKTSGNKVIFDNVKITGLTGGVKCFDNGQVSGAGVGDFTFETWFRNCWIEGGESLGRFGLIVSAINCTLKNVGSNFGRTASRSGFKTLAGCHLIGGAGDSSIAALYWIGNLSDSVGGTMVSPVPAMPDASYWGEGTGGASFVRAAFQLFMFNRWPTCTKTITIFGGDGTEKSGLLRGGVFSMNEVEVADAKATFGQADAKGGQFSADGNAWPIPEVIANDNTVVGDGVNWVYNENGLARVAKHLYARRNLAEDWNHKGDHWDQSTAHEEKTGNYAARFKVDQHFNVVFGKGSFISKPSPGNNFGDALGLTNIASAPGAILSRIFVLDRSFYSASPIGGGDYRPTGACAAIGILPDNANAYPEDLKGFARLTAAGGGAVGAYEKAA